jgi:hypothetical protein
VEVSESFVRPDSVHTPDKLSEFGDFVETVVVRLFLEDITINFVIPNWENIWPDEMQ